MSLDRSNVTLQRHVSPVRTRPIRLLILLALLLSPPAAAQPARTPVQAVAAEAVCAGILRGLAGDGASVTRTLNNPDADPHLFEAGPAAALAVGAAWGGLAPSYWTDWPPSVGITALRARASSQWPPSPSPSRKGRSGYSPRNTGRRFSMKAVLPSR